MLKKLSVLLSLALVVTLLSLNGCSKSDAPTSPGTADTQNQSAPTGQFDPNFPSTYADATVTPLVPTMGGTHVNWFIQFIVKFVGLNADQQAALQTAFDSYNTCLQSIRADIKAGKYTDATTNKIDRKAVMTAIKACYTDYQTAMTTFYASLDAGQKAKWDKLFHRKTGGTGGTGGGIVAPGIIDELDLNVDHNDATINAYENEVTESASPSVMMDPRGPRGFLGFLVRALKLTDAQIAAIKDYVQNTYNPALKDAFTTLQQATKDFRTAMKAATTDAEKQAAKATFQAALKTARDAVKAAHDALIAFMTNDSGGAGLTADQITLFKRIFRIK